MPSASIGCSPMACQDHRTEQPWGTAGGVKSNVSMKATDWITYSFDVKMDGENACRHTDKKFHNNQNTVDLAGNLDPNNPPAGLTPEQRALWKPCVEQHEKYKKIQEKEANHRTDEFNDLKSKVLREIESTSPIKAPFSERAEAVRDDEDAGGGQQGQD